jgi:hypothetical protein
MLADYPLLGICSGVYIITEWNLWHQIDSRIRTGASLLSEDSAYSKVRIDMDQHLVSLVNVLRTLYRADRQFAFVEALRSLTAKSAAQLETFFQQSDEESDKIIYDSIALIRSL